MDREADGHRWTERLMDTGMDRQMDTDEWTDRWTGIGTDGQTGEMD